MTELRSRIGLIDVSGAPTMRRVNGIGPSIAGGFSEPLAPGYFYKQFVLTFIYVPVFLGFIYLVRGSREEGYQFAGRIKFGHFVRRFGFPAYLRFLCSVFLESAGLLVVMLLALALAYGAVFVVMALFRGMS